MNFKLKRFFWTYLCLTVPMLLVSLLIAGLVSDRVLQKEEEKQMRQLEETCTRLQETISDYSDEAILLASQYDLLPHKLQGSYVDVRKAVELLRLKRMVDGHHTDIFIDLGTDQIYSSAGVTGRTVYISSLLSDREADIERCEEILNSGENTVELFLDSDTDGYLMCSFYIEKSGDNRRILNYLLSLAYVKDILRLQDEDQVYELETGSGRVLVLGYNDGNEVRVIEREAWERQKGQNEYIILEEEMPAFDMKLRAYYSKAAIWEDSGIYHMQLTNIILILLAVFLSAVMSWKLSARRVREIGTLEANLKGEDTSRISERSVFSQLQDSILSDVNKRKEFEQKMQETFRELREAKARRIFLGGIGDKKELDLLFRELGLEGCPECFFVGAIAVEKQVSDGALSEVLPGCLVAHSRYKEHEVVLFLYELRIMDENRVLRQKIAEDIRRYLGETNVYVGMSKVYKEEKLIDVAYEEAMHVLDKLISGEINTFSRCWEDSIRNVRFLLPDAQGLAQFVRALKDGDVNRAEKWLHFVLSGSDVKGCTVENQEYIRYAILQALVQYLCEEDVNVNAHILKSCLNISVKDERKFVQSVEKMIKRCLEDKEVDDFSKMLAYIEKNYGRSDLTYEEVAAAGGVSKTYISKMFRSKLGMSYVEYIAQVRMNRACVLLKNTDYSINDIAGMVGYDNLSSFGRSFKGKFGISAAEYRKSMKGLNAGND